jgi:hypothetical protein
LITRRTAGSSSTTKTTGASVMRPKAIELAKYMEKAPLGARLSRQPPPVARYHRTLDRQSDSHALRFGGKDGFDDTLLLPRIDSLRRIPNLTKHVVMLSI